jgi:predicted ATPase
MEKKPASDSLILRSVKMVRFGEWPDRFPFSVSVIQNLEELVFHSPVTFLVGENGSGKSTFLEALACAVGSITVGSESVEHDRTMTPLRQLAKSMKLVWSKRTHKGFFMRSEDFFGFARRMDQTRVEMETYLDEVEQEYKGRSETAKAYGRMAYQNELGGMQQKYGEGVDARSHGESYLALFQARFVPGGLYLLDEPEAPLSPKRQLAFLVMLQTMIARQAQFIIATHSPIILGFPGATILSCDSGKLAQVPYEELEHVYITRDFLIHPGLYMKNLGLTGSIDEEV